MARGGLLIAFSAAILAVPVASVTSDFSFYPKGSQNCLNTASKSSKCTGDTFAVLNKCLCGNGGNFVTNAATCLGKEDPGDVKAVYASMEDACNGSGTPLTVSSSQFQKLADDAAAKASTTSAASTAAATSSPTSGSAIASPTETKSAASSSSSSSSSSGGGLSSGAKIGIAVAATALGVAALVGAGAFFFMRRRRQAAADEAHPMLPQNDYYNASQQSPGFTQYRESKASWGSPSPSPGLDPNRISALSSVYTGPYASPPPQSELQRVGEVAELPPTGVAASWPQAVEMEGSVPARHYQ